jgi:quercetin dioxygenase-like cupin family protein
MMEGSRTIHRPAAERRPVVEASRPDVRVFDVVLSTQEIRVIHMALAPGQEVPWHLHTHVQDTFFVLHGPVTIHTRDPEGSRAVASGEMFRVNVGQPHRVVNGSDGEVDVILVQGPGEYDFKALPALVVVPSEAPLE